MRRTSDQEHGGRTGFGRRARDRMLAGETHPSPSLGEREELRNVVLFLGDDLRESALAVGGIEAFLLDAQRVLEKPDLTAEELARLLSNDRIGDRLELLADALASLRRSMGLICSTLK